MYIGEYRPKQKDRLEAVSPKPQKVFATARAHLKGSCAVTDATTMRLYVGLGQRYARSVFLSKNALQ